MSFNYQREKRMFSLISLIAFYQCEKKSRKWVIVCARKSSKCHIILPFLSWDDFMAHKIDLHSLFILESLSLKNSMVQSVRQIFVLLPRTMPGQQIMYT